MMTHRERSANTLETGVARGANGFRTPQICLGCCHASLDDNLEEKIEIEQNGLKVSKA